MSNEVAGSKEGQDELVLKLLGIATPDRPRYFLDLGSAHPIFGNNTILLEKAGWTGLLFDINEWAVKEAGKTRPHSKAFHMDLCKEPIEPVLVANHAPFIIDYISFDVDGATLDLVESFPFDKYQFRIMTYEHDSYCAGSAKKAAMMGRLLAPIKKCAGQYRIAAEDVGFGDNEQRPLPFEDWYFDNTIYPQAKAEGVHWRDVLKYFGA